MNRPRHLPDNKKLPRGVHPSDGSYYRVYYDAQGKRKWQRLSRIADGELALYEALAKLAAPAPLSEYSVPACVDRFLKDKAHEWTPKVQTDFGYTYAKIKQAFADFHDIRLVRRKHCIDFLKQFPAKSRGQQHHKSRLFSVFEWAITQDLIEVNPLAGFKMPAPAPRTVLMTHEHYRAIVQQLEPVYQCFMHLAYLTGQRVTDVRTLKFNQIGEDAIAFKPSKTSAKTAAVARVPLSPAIRSVLAKARSMGPVANFAGYVLHDEQGQPLRVRAIHAAFLRAMKAAGVSGYTTRDLRAKHASDAIAAGYSREQIQAGLAHATGDTTEIYFKRQGAIDYSLPLP